jgi:hypothetical protein
VFGEITGYPPRYDKFPTNTPTVIDLANRTIKLPRISACGIDPCPLIEVTPSNISFMVGGSLSLWGEMDRFTGKMTITGEENGASLTLYVLTCKPAKALF